MFTWKRGVTDAQRVALSDALATLPALIPGLRAFRFGPDAGLGSGNDEFAVIAEFDHAEGFRAYAVDPHHVDVIERLLTPMLGTRHAVQFASA